MLRSLWEFIWDVLMEPRKGNLIPRDPDPEPVREPVPNDLLNLTGCPCDECQGRLCRPRTDPNALPGRGVE
jgi:hypothetical protein